MGIVLGLLLLAGCSDIFGPASTPSAGKGGLQITIVGTEGERTLYPQTNFSKYELEFTGDTPYESKTLPAGDTAITLNDIPTGTWTVKATGYVSINAVEYAAAEGESTITVTSGDFTSVSITLSAKQTGEDGFFTWQISYPASVKEAKVFISVSGGYSTYSGGTSHTITNGVSDSVNLDPGYYLVSIQLTTGYQIVAWTEIIHIYANMETKAVKTFTENDLTKITTLGGTATITMNGEPVDYFYGLVYRIVADHGYEYWDRIGDSGVYPDDGQWELSLPEIAAGTTLYLELIIPGATYSRTIGPLTVTGAYVNVPITININTITLSGTATVTVNDERPEHVYIEARTAYGGQAGSEFVGSTGIDLDTGYWEMQIESFDTSTEVYFEVYGYDLNGNWFDRTFPDSVISVHNTDISDIDFTFNIANITLSGTYDVKINGVPAGGDIFVGIDGNYRAIGSTYMDADYDGIWVFQIDGEYFGETVYISVEAWLDENNRYQKNNVLGPIVLDNTTISSLDISVNFVEITLSGTASLTINGRTPTQTKVQLLLSSNSEYITETTVNSNGTWSIRLLTFDTPTELSLEVVGILDGARFGSAVDTRTVYNTPIAGINLTKSVTGLIRIGGSISFPYGTDWFGIIAELGDGSWLGGTWEGNNSWGIWIESFTTNTTVYFSVEGGWDNWDGDNYFRYEKIHSATIRNQNVTNINIVVPSP